MTRMNAPQILTSAPSRRRFLSLAGSVAAGVMVVPRYVLGGVRFVPPSERVNVALVG